MYVAPQYFLRRPPWRCTRESNTLSCLLIVLNRADATPLAAPKALTVHSHVRRRDYCRKISSIIANTLPSACMMVLRLQARPMWTTTCRLPQQCIALFDAHLLYFFCKIVIHSAASNTKLPTHYCGAHMIVRELRRFGQLFTRKNTRKAHEE